MFDHRKFHDLSANELKATFRRACTYLGFRGVRTAIVNEYKTLIDKIKEARIELCENDMSSPVLAWAVYLKHFEPKEEKDEDTTEVPENIENLQEEEPEQFKISDELKRIILSAIIIPMGSAQGKAKKA